jgi:hypothetical protein
LNGDKHALDIAENIVVLEPKHAVTFLTQAAISYRVRSRRIVLSAIDLNNQTAFATDEIADVVCYRVLTHEFMSIDLPVTDTIPENSLCVCLIDAQPSCNLGGLPIWSAHGLASLPDRLPHAGEIRKKSPLNQSAARMLHLSLSPF